MESAALNCGNNDEEGVKPTNSEDGRPLIMQELRNISDTHSKSVDVGKFLEPVPKAISVYHIKQAEEIKF